MNRHKKWQHDQIAAHASSLQQNADLRVELDNLFPSLPKTTKPVEAPKKKKSRVRVEKPAVREVFSAPKVVITSVAAVKLQKEIDAVVERLNHWHRLVQECQPDPTKRSIPVYRSSLELYMSWKGMDPSRLLTKWKGIPLQVLPF